MAFTRKMPALPVDPVLIAFIFVGIHQSVDEYTIFRFEALYNLSLGVSWLLKEWIWNMLGDECRETRAIKSKSRSNSTFKTAKITLLSALNIFLTDCQNSLVGTGVQVKLKKPGQSKCLTALFTQTSLIGVLEGADYVSIDLVFTFLSAIVAECCGLELFADVAGVYTKYVAMVNHIYRWNLSPGWTMK